MIIINKYIQNEKLDILIVKVLLLQSMEQILKKITMIIVIAI